MIVGNVVLQQTGWQDRTLDTLKAPSNFGVGADGRVGTTKEET